MGDVTHLASMATKKSSTKLDNSEILRRLDSLENLLKSKDDEIARLNKRIDEEVALREKSLSELQNELQQKIEQSHTTKNCQNKTVEDVEVVEKDLLVIGDSLLKGVTPSNLGLNDEEASVISIPGARPVDISEEFRNQINLGHSYKRILVHVGSNLIPKFAPEVAAAKITQCMEYIRQLAPHSKLAFSPILPKLGSHLNAGINYISTTVFRSGEIGPRRTRFGHADHVRMVTGNCRFGRVNPGLFVSDGIHLSQRGMNAFTDSLKSFINM